MKKTCDCVCHKLGYTYCDCPTHAAFGNTQTDDTSDHTVACARMGRREQTTRGGEMSAALNSEARAALRNAGISPKEWAKIQGQPDGKWYGDRCGCNDDRCIGYHHDESDTCGCLPALLEWHWRDLAANAHEGAK